MIVLVLLIVLIIILILIYNKYYNMKKIQIKEVYEIEQKCKELYTQITLKKLFKKYPKKIKGLHFGYICPGAMKTIEYLNKNSKKFDIKLLNNIKLLTDLQFFIEIYVIYKKYIDEELVNKIRKIIKNNACNISKTITNEITNLFGELPLQIKTNLPDDFYHIRHNTLICSKNKEMANARIKLLKSLYGSFENFNNNFTNCLGKRNGKSGCRDCCNSYFSDNYKSCVNSCMAF